MRVRMGIAFEKIVRFCGNRCVLALIVLYA